MTNNDRDVVETIARQHLAPEDAEKWLRLLRPAVELLPAADGDAVVARLGGLPLLPAGTPWPVWEGNGPLSFIGEIDLAALAGQGFELDIALPTEGLLSLFYWDGSVDGGVEIVGTWDKESLAGVRLLHLTAPRHELVPTETAAGAYTYRERALSGVQIVTDPGAENGALRDVFDPERQLDDRAWWNHPVLGDAFTEALWERRSGPRHQIGGWAAPVQGPVEYEVAVAALPDGAEGAQLVEEGANWRLLVQIDSDDDMMWGDGGSLYWMARQDDLAAGRLSNVLFTWQCS